MTLASLRARHFANNVFDTAKFAQTVTIKNAAGTTYAPAAIVRRKESVRTDDNGRTYLYETAVVVVQQSDLPSKPDIGWSLYLSGDGKAFMYALEATIDDLTYTLTFDRITYKVS